MWIFVYYSVECLFCTVKNCPLKYSTTFRVYPDVQIFPVDFLMLNVNHEHILSTGK